MIVSRKYVWGKTSYTRDLFKILLPPQIVARGSCLEIDYLFPVEEPILCLGSGFSSIEVD